MEKIAIKIPSNKNLSIKIHRKTEYRTAEFWKQSGFYQNILKQKLATSRRQSRRVIGKYQTKHNKGKCSKEEGNSVVRRKVTEEEYWIWFTKHSTIGLN